MPLGTWLERFAQDVRFGVRNLAKSPGFTSIAVASLALGIMATTAMYSVIHGVVLHPFPYKDVDSLMSVKVWDPGARGYRTYYTPDQYLEIRDRATIFDGVIASTISDVLWTGESDPQRLRGNHISTNTFEVMGVPPLLGRWVTGADGAPGAEPVAVLGYRFWQRQFAGNPAVLGRRLRLNDTVRTVVGVMPRRFMWRGADVYVPVVYRRGEVVEGVRNVHVLGRLKLGVNEARAEADLRPIIEELRAREPAQFPEKFRVGLLSFAETFPSGIREALWILFGAVGLLLVIACANVSNLLVARAATRQREMAVRASLGASRARLVRQLLTESLLLALAGCALGVPLAFGGLKAIIALVPPNTIPDESEIVVNLPVLAFSLTVSILTALVFGLAPALYACSRDLANPLKEAGRTAGGGRRRALLRSSLVVAEVALSLVLLAGASLMMRTLAAMENVDLGIRPDRLLTLRIPLPEKRYASPERRIAFFRELLERAQATPGVAAAGLNTGLHPLGNWGMPIEAPGMPQNDTRPALLHQVNPGYLEAFGIGLLEGRVFAENEVAARQHVALVNQAFGRRYAGSRPAVGMVFRIPRLRSAPFNLADDSFQVVGVVRDTVNRTTVNEVLPEVYFPYTVTAMADRLVLLARGDPASLAGAIRAQVRAVDREQPVTDVRTIGALLDEYVYSQARFNLALLGVFASIGLALAAVGVYGVISHSVTQRTQELGVRVALGAGSGAIVRMVISGGLKLLAAGIAIGLAGGLASARLLEGQLWRVSPFDPAAFAGATAFLLLVGLQACLWPALRAARLDPVRALRYE